MSSDIKLSFSKSSGSSLIEVLVGILILAVGILGMAAMQLSAKRIGFDAMQRSIATSLAHDILERMRSNPDVLSEYVINNLGVASVEPLPNCITVVCNAAQLAAHDLWEWEQSLIGVQEQVIDGTPAGGLVNPRACITENNGLVTVAITWKGFQTTESTKLSTCGQGLGLYGELDSERQIVFFTTVISR
jgi:type IV pilus assembly protein PilV